MLRMAEADKAGDDQIDARLVADIVAGVEQAFVELYRQGRNDLTGLGRGPAMAVAHVGIELLLDGMLAGDDATLERYYQALEAPVSWRDPDEARTFAALAARLRTAPLPRAYSDPEFTADRIERMLSRRPRLALPHGARDDVVAWLERLQHDAEVWAERLVEETMLPLRASPG